MTYVITPYIAGIFLVGVPMAKLSLWFYKTGDKMDTFPWRKRFFLTIVRNACFPSFITEARGNSPHLYRDCASDASFMTGIVGEDFFGSCESLDPAKCMTYTSLSSAFWPVRVGWNFLFSVFGLAVLSLEMVLRAPEFLTWLFRRLSALTSASREA